MLDSPVRSRRRSASADSCYRSSPTMTENQALVTSPVSSNIFSSPVAHQRNMRLKDEMIRKLKDDLVTVEHDRDEKAQTVAEQEIKLVNILKRYDELKREKSSKADELLRCSEEANNVDKTNKDMIAKREQLIARVTDLKQKLDTTEDKYWKCHGEKRQLEESHKRLECRAADLKRENADLVAENQNLNQMLHDAEGQRDGLEKSLNHLMTEQETMARQHEEIHRAQKEQRAEEKDRLECDLATEMAKNQQLTDQVRKLTAQNKILETDLERRVETEKSLKLRCSELKSELDSALNDIGEFKEDLTKIGQSLQFRDQQIAELTEENQSVKNEMLRDRGRCERKIADLKRQVEEARLKNMESARHKTQLNMTLGHLEECKAEHERQMTDKENVIEGLMEKVKHLTGQLQANITFDFEKKKLSFTDEKIDSTISSNTDHQPKVIEQQQVSPLPMTNRSEILGSDIESIPSSNLPIHTSQFDVIGEHNYEDDVMFETYIPQSEGDFRKIEIQDHLMPATPVLQKTLSNAELFKQDVVAKQTVAVPSLKDQNEQVQAGERGNGAPSYAQFIEPIGLPPSFGSKKRRSSSADSSPTTMTLARMRELMRRNSMHQPHNRSFYALETGPFFDNSKLQEQSFRDAKTEFQLPVMPKTDVKKVDKIRKKILKRGRRSQSLASPMTAEELQVVQKPSLDLDSQLNGGQNVSQNFKTPKSGFKSYISRQFQALKNPFSPTQPQAFDSKLQKSQKMDIQFNSPRNKKRAKKLAAGKQASTATTETQTDPKTKSNDENARPSKKNKQ